MGVADADLRELMRLAEEQRRESVDLFQFTRLVADNFSRDERLRLVEAIWGVVYSDGTLTEAENRLARRIAEMLGFQHPEVQAVKDRVAERPEVGCRPAEDSEKKFMRSEGLRGAGAPFCAPRDAVRPRIRQGR